MKKTFWLLLLMAFFAASCSSQEKPKPIETSAFEKKIYKTMPYRLFVPAGYDKNKKYPLVLWLHGGWARGNDNEKPLIEGNTINL